MLNANQIKPGVVINVANAPYIVQNVIKQTPSARGAKTLYKIRAKNLLTGQNTNQTCTEDDSFIEPDFAIRASQYLYEDGSYAVFVDLENYEQYEVSLETLGEQKNFLLENMEGIGVLILEGKAVGIKLPDTIIMELVECAPGVKGASATARPKPATTNTGLVIQVPEYMEVGEKVKVRTENGEFLGRA